MRRLIAVLALLVTAPAAAQAPSRGQPAIPVEVLAPNEEARTAFEALASHPLTAEMVEAAIQAHPGQSIRPMDDLIDRSFAPGELVPNWQRSGVDLRATIASRNGGLVGNMIEGASQFGTASAYYADRPIETFVAPEWVLIGQHGTRVEGENVAIEVSPLSPKVTLVERIAYRRQNNAYCRLQAESRFYANTTVPASKMDLIAIVVGMRSLTTVEHRSMCEVAEDLGQGQYRFRVYDSEGHRMEGIERNPPQFRIVPFRPALSPPASR